MLRAGRNQHLTNEDASKDGIANLQVFAATATADNVKVEVRATVAHPVPDSLKGGAGYAGTFTVLGGAQLCGADWLFYTLRGQGKLNHCLEGDCSAVLGRAPLYAVKLGAPQAKAIKLSDEAPLTRFYAPHSEGMFAPHLAAVRQIPPVRPMLPETSVAGITPIAERHPHLQLLATVPVEPAAWRSQHRLHRKHAPLTAFTAFDQQTPGVLPTSSAELRQLAAQDLSAARSCYDAIARFAWDGKVVRYKTRDGLRRLHGDLLGFWRLRVEGNWRVVFLPLPHARKLRVIRVRHRENAYLPSPKTSR